VSDRVGMLERLLRGPRPDGRPRHGVGLSAAFVWLGFILFPLVNAVARHEPALDHALTIAGAVVFVAAYVALVISWRAHAGETVTWLLFAVLVVVAVALTLGDRPGWGFLFTYCAACTSLIAPASYAFGMVLVCAALAGGTTLLSGANGGTAIGLVASSAGIGLLVMLVRGLRVSNDELREARAELARLAVARERERFARDLHDLLGHTLSVIALKAELAGRLLPERPGEAAGEVADVERVARTALSEVRDAVSGYRQPTLDDELAGARMALSAAGISADVREPVVKLDPTVEAVLAWAVREGATNVIRHSGAANCVVKVSANLTEAEVEVVDDGVGAAMTNGAPGNGLTGLAERARTLGGRVEGGALPGGGYRLAVVVPVAGG
jgi:two-component system, NarL family, sensor histidine kinase DesK